MSIDVRRFFRRKPGETAAGREDLPSPEQLGMPQPAPTVANKLGLVKFNPDTESHLRIIDSEVCRRRCRQKFCTHSCPAQVYRWEEEEKQITVAFEGCLECGTCRSGGCPYENIEMRYPRGGFGAQYRFG
ncbi:MAG: ferredoxin family protein [Thermoleophilia bacterium]|jgi:ferredoxin like protein